MKKFNVFLPAFAGKSYEVEANSSKEAEEKAREIADLSEVEASEWDYDTEPDISELKEDNEEADNLD